MRVASWNVNGLRSIAGKGFLEWLRRSGADVVGVQETRCTPDQVPADLRPRGWHTHFVCAKRPGYSGVGMYSRRPLDGVTSALGVRTLDAEGRLQIAKIGRLTIANVYFPNGSGVTRDNSRVPFKLRFYRRLRDALEPARAAGEPILVMGDFNTAPHEIDLARPKTNRSTSGFLPVERRELARWIDLGWIDTFREFEKGGGHYTWWSQRYGVRERNVGWRLDLVLASPGAMRFVRGAAIHPEVKGSDHCPVSVDLDDRIVHHG
jgi:exodeoxyribonuclease-3